MNSRLRLWLAIAPLCLLCLFLIFGKGSQPGEREPAPGEQPGASVAQRVAMPARGSRNLESATQGRPSEPEATDSIASALAAGIPLRVTAGAQFDLQVRPMRALAEEFQVTVGANFAQTMDRKVSVFEGWAVTPTGLRRGRATVAIVNGTLGAVVRHPDGAVTELKTDPETGEFLALRLDRDSAEASCARDESALETVTTMRSEVEPFTEADWERAEIAPLWGSDPATGKITKYEQPLPNGSQYDRSLPDATVMVVLAKDATGADSAANLASRASTYLARMANVATIWENQLGIRLLVSELILTPDTAAYEDVGETLSNFRDWGELKRPRDQFPRSVAARFGNLGFSGSVVGTAYVGTVGGSLGYSINKWNFNFTLLSHEMGHNFGSGHSSGGIMNANLLSGQRDFFRDVSSSETAAKKIYDRSVDLLIGPATMRHAEEIPFARDDSRSTPLDTPLLIEPLGNDDDAVRNGATNTLSIAEVSRVFPSGAGTAEVAGDTVIVFTPTPSFEGFAWFSYSLQGDVGNGGQGWLHRGDVAVLVGTNPASPTNLTLAPGESIIFDPPGSGGATIPTQATQAQVDVTRDDNKLLVVRADATATGIDSFVVRRSSVDYTINITYAARAPVGGADVILLESGLGSLRFNPMANDEGVGYRRPLQRGARIGVDGTSEDYFVNAFRLVSATNLNPEKGTLTLESIDVVRDGLNVSAPSGFLHFVPLAGASGVAEIEYVIEDATGMQTTEIASIVLSFLEITCPTSDTVYLPPGTGLAVEGVTSSSNAGALSGRVTVSWQIVSAPPGATVTITDPQAITTSMQFSDPGSYLLRATGADHGYATFQDLAVEVTAAPPGGENLGATVTLTDAVINVPDGGPFDLTPALPMVSDDGLPAPPSVTTTTWSLVNGPGPVVFGDPALPATSATFPFPGSYTLRLTADDGELKTFDEVAVIYTGPGNGVPVTSGIADVNVSVDTGEVEIDLFSAFEDGEDSDADLVYTLEATSDPALFNTITIAGDPEKLTLQFAAVTDGVSQVTVRATDTDGFFVEATFTVTISNSPPVIAPIPDQIVMEAQTLNLGVAANDPDNHGLAYTLIAGSPSGMTIDAVSGALSWTPGEAAGPGSYPVVVKVIDDSSQALSALRYFRVTVEEVNLPPDLVLISDLVDFAQPDFALTFTVNDPDLPANPLAFSLVSKPPGASIDGPGRTIHWRPAMAGTYDFTVRVDDGGTPNLSDTESFSLTVTNAAPTMADQGFTIAENSPVSTEVGTVAASDGDGDGFTFAITGGNPGAAFAIDPNSGLITVTSSAPLDFEAASSLSLTVEATDDGAPPLARLATVTVNLTDLNEAPSLPDQVVEVEIGEVFGAVIGTVAASDPENDVLTYAILSGNEAGVFALDPQSGELRIAAQATLGQASNLTIEVSDSGAPALSDSGVVTISLIQPLVVNPADARIFVPVDGSLAASWKALAFDDSGWTAGQTGVGYERESGYEALINTDVETEMYDTNASVWIRIPFTVSNPAAFTNLALRMNYDDGYVACLNGQEIARRNVAAGTPPWNATALAERDDALATEIEEVDVSAFVNELVTGENVLAIHGLNDSTTSPDLLIVPQLLSTNGGTIGLTTLPTLAPGSASGIMPTSADLQGDLTFDGGEAPEVLAFWGTSDGGTDPASWDQSQSLGVLSEGGFSLPISGLVPDTTYSFRFQATNSAGTAWSGPTQTFTSAPPQVTEVLIATGGTARYLVPTDATDEVAWRAQTYDDAGWASGPSGFGYERESGYQQLIGTDLEAPMFGQNSTVYLRLPFHLADPASLTSLTLRMKHDDAYVAFLNGVEIARSPNAPNLLTWDAEATSPREDLDALSFENIDVLAAATTLAEGENVLAIHGMNDASSSPDLLVLAELVATYPEASYPGWVATFPQLQGDDRLLNRDPDGDLMTNSFEWAFGWDPTVPELNARKASTPDVRPGGSTVPPSPGATVFEVEVRFRRRIDYEAQGLSYEVETSTDLEAESWLPTFGQPTTMLPEPTGDGITELVTLLIFAEPTAAGGTSSPRRFYRIGASRAE